MEVTQASFRSKVTRSQIHRISMAAEDSGKASRGTVLVLHGLGDHIGCHSGAMKIFSSLGYRSEGFDWPGNGKSEGNRGDIPGVRPAIKLIKEVIDSLDEPPVALYAHSTGAFLALPFLSRFRDELPLDWIWLSSPLLRPTHRQSRVKLWAAEFLADFAPELSIPTGVKPSRCYHLEHMNPATLAEKFKGCHSRISARFGRDLILWESEAAHSATKLEDPLQVLMTQGKDDLICPPNYAEEMFQTIPSSNKTLLMLDGIRHEPFREPENQQFIDSVTDWLSTKSKTVLN